MTAGMPIRRIRRTPGDSGVGVVGGPWGLYGNPRPFVVHRPDER
ncbi:hypothetical protein GA0115260_1057917 [Streptomyces sp. MnatMP-M27]|nr:hypothetical protein GA0115260_1057917 [Streptomyces sp. MnatMP-M27]